MENWLVKISATLGEIDAEVEAYILKDLSEIEMTEQFSSLLDAELTLLGLNEGYADCNPDVIVSKIVSVLGYRTPQIFMLRANLCGTRFSFTARTV